MSPLVAIDGPAGSGKSTVARLLAERLGLERLDTGAMYRAVTFLVLQKGASPGDDVTAAELARTMRLELGERVVLNGRDVTDEIRLPAVDAAVSEVSSHPAVRAELVSRQRAWAAGHGGGVVEGRDIGSVVFPEADLKVFLTAHPGVRAARRAAERPTPAGEATESELAEIVKRDERDSSRATSPLQVAEGALVVDSSELSLDEVLAEVLRRL